MPKKFYVTHKQVNDYIIGRFPKFEDLSEFKMHVHRLINELSEFPEQNKNQIKFYSRVELTLGDWINLI